MVVENNTKRARHLNVSPFLISTIYTGSINAMTVNILSEKAIESKICNECGKSFPPTAEFWYQDKGCKCGLKSCCKSCCKEKYTQNKEKIAGQSKARYEKNKKEISRKYRANAEQICKRRKEHYKQNKKEILSKNKEYRRKNKEKISKQTQIYLVENKDKLIKYRKKRSMLKFKYSSATRVELSIYEELRKSDCGEYVELKCAYCGRWIIPTNIQVRSRIEGARGTANGEFRFYCSDDCKMACPIYHKKSWPMGFKKATSREANPILRQLVLKRDGYTCQKCGVTIQDAQLHCHHVLPATQNPMTANDPDNCTTLCKECHKAVHKIPGCGYHELKCGKAS